jgi:hypothetical protein
MLDGGKSPTGAGVIIKSHRDLIVWQKAMDLAVVIYDATEHFPKETYGLTKHDVPAVQFRRT